jgi:phosphate transport system permease protein
MKPLGPPSARVLLRRRLTNAVAVALATGAALLALLALGWVLWTLVGNGLAGLNWALFTALPKPPGEPGGGLANAMFGTLMVTGLAIVLGVPIGLLGGIYLAEFGRSSAAARAVRFVSDVMMGVPSIVVGLFAYGLLVRPMDRFSGVAGAVALAVLMLPIVTRTTDEMLRLVPSSLREAALALGAPEWRMVTKVSIRAALPGILTGVILAVARVSGETAPLLFTSLNSPYWNFDPSMPTPTLNVTMFNYAMSPYEDWRRTAWAAALVITAGVLVLTIVARRLRPNDR